MGAGTGCGEGAGLGVGAGFGPEGGGGVERCVVGVLLETGWVAALTGVTATEVAPPWADAVRCDGVERCGGREIAGA